MSAKKNIYSVGFDLSETVIVEASDFTEALARYREWSRGDVDEPPVGVPMDPDSITLLVDHHGMIPQPNDERTVR